MKSHLYLIKESGAEKIPARKYPGNALAWANRRLDEKGGQRFTSTENTLDAELDNGRFLSLSHIA